MTTIARRLDVYVANHCLNCADALALAEEAAARFSDVVVRVIDLDLEQEPPPDNVVAVPTYVLDGRTISLGTACLFTDHLGTLRFSAMTHGRVADDGEYEAGTHRSRLEDTQRQFDRDLDARLVASGDFHRFA